MRLRESAHLRSCVYRLAIVIWMIAAVQPASADLGQSSYLIPLGGDYAIWYTGTEDEKPADTSYSLVQIQGHYSNARIVSHIREIDI